MIEKTAIASFLVAILAISIFIVNAFIARSTVKAMLKDKVGGVGLDVLNEAEIMGNSGVDRDMKAAQLFITNV